MGCCCSDQRVDRNVYQLQPLIPRPSDSELEADGGQYFVRPSDGRTLEFFLRNEGHDVAILNVVCTSCTGRLYHVWHSEAIIAHLEQHQVTLINVSAAGVGTSEPYGDWLGALDATEYLERTAIDLTALLRHLGVKEVFTMGISGGWTPSACLAVKLAVEERSEVRLRGICCISGIPWETQEENFWEKSMGKGCTFALTTRLLESSVSPFMMNSLFPMNEEKTIKSFPKEVQLELGTELSKEVARDINRANAYYLFVSAFLGRLTTNSRRNRLPQFHEDLTKISPSIQVHLHMSTRDTLVPTERVVASVKSKVPHAIHFQNALPHMAPPFEFAIKKLLEIDLE